ncbi:MAG: hypothetical protein OEZ06_32720 [Myxococcales bacterium]|nr:hypothetical protein [Myxococcales bacterium]
MRHEARRMDAEVTCDQHGQARRQTREPQLSSFAQVRILERQLRLKRPTAVL